MNRGDAGFVFGDQLTYDTCSLVGGGGRWTAGTWYTLSRRMGPPNARSLISAYRMPKIVAQAGPDDDTSGMVSGDEVEQMVSDLEPLSVRFLGLTYQAAIETADALNVQLRIITQEPFDLDMRVNRMNIEFRERLVVKAWAG